MTDQLWSTLNQAIANGSRSTALKPLAWLIALTLAGSIGAFRLGSPMWLSTSLGVLCIISILLYILAYLYFGFTDKDALRSERYSIQKLAIQKGFFGDDETGYFPLSNSVASPALPSPDQDKGPEEAV